jgi:hypothetical protein
MAIIAKELVGHPLKVGYQMFLRANSSQGKIPKRKKDTLGKNGAFPWGRSKPNNLSKSNPACNNALI